MGKSACLPILNVNLTMKGDGDVVTRDDTRRRAFLGYLFCSCLHYNRILVLVVKVSDLSGVFNQLQFWYLDRRVSFTFLHVCGPLAARNGPATRTICQFHTVHTHSTHKLNHHISKHISSSHILDLWKARPCNSSRVECKRISERHNPSAPCGCAV